MAHQQIVPSRITYLVRDLRHTQHLACAGAQHYVVNLGPSNLGAPSQPSPLAGQLHELTASGGA